MDVSREIGKAQLLPRVWEVPECAPKVKAEGQGNGKLVRI